MQTSLWEPQKQALQRLSETFQSNNEDHFPPQIIQIPTGCGKSTVMALSPRYIFPHSNDPWVILVVVPNLTLVDQTYNSIFHAYQRHPLLDEEEIEREEVNVHRITSREDLQHQLDLLDQPLNHKHYHFFVCNIHKLHEKGFSQATQAQWQRLSTMIDLILIDEGHHIPARMWKTFLFHPQRLGNQIKKQIVLTATPFRTDRLPLMGELCYRYPYRTAVTSGLIKHPVLHVLSSSPSCSTQRREIQLFKRTERLLRLSNQDQPFPKNQAIGFARNIQHAQRLVRLAHQYTSLRTAVWHCKMSNENQVAVRTNFEQRHPHDPQRLDMIIQVRMCSEGYDHPPVKIITFFKTVKSRLVLMQNIGRASRRTIEDRRLGRNLLSHIVVNQSHLSPQLWQRFKSYPDPEETTEDQTELLNLEDDETDLSSSDDADGDDEGNIENPNIVLSEEEEEEEIVIEEEEFIIDTIENLVPFPSIHETGIAQPFLDQPSASLPIHQTTSMSWFVDYFDLRLLPTTLIHMIEGPNDQNDDDSDNSDNESDDPNDNHEIEDDHVDSLNDDEIEDDDNNNDNEEIIEDDEEIIEEIDEEENFQNNEEIIFNYIQDQNFPDTNNNFHPNFEPSTLKTMATIGATAKVPLRSRLDILKDIPIRKNAFKLSSSHLQVVVSPTKQKKHSVKKKSGRPRKGAPHIEDLTPDDVRLAFLPPPHQDLCIAFARYDCNASSVRELDLWNLQKIFNDHLKPEKIGEIIRCSNRTKDGLPMIGDRLFGYYYEIRAIPLTTQPSLASSSSSRKRVECPTAANKDQPQEGGEAVKKQKTAAIPSKGEISVKEALLKIEAKEEKLKQAKEILQKLLKKN